jgi:phage regulator Rha-like protein
LIAGELGIEHRGLRQTVEKYLNELQEFGTITFQMSSSRMPDGRINPKPERYCFLNEDQATFLMTLSRNTPQVVACKQNLVKAFSKAKELIKEVNPAKSDRELEIEKIRAITENVYAISKTDVEKMRELKNFSPPTQVEYYRLEQERVKEQAERAKTEAEQLRLERSKIVHSPKKETLYPVGTTLLTPEQLKDKLITDMAAYIDKMVNEKGIKPKIRDLQQKFQSRKVPDDNGKLVRINANILRSLLPEALERCECDRENVLLGLPLNRVRVSRTH